MTCQPAGKPIGLVERRLLFPRFEMTEEPSLRRRQGVSPETVGPFGEREGQEPVRRVVAHVSAGSRQGQHLERRYVSESVQRGLVVTARLSKPDAAFNSASLRSTRPDGCGGTSADCSAFSPAL